MGWLVTLEGTEGSGKSTLIRTLQKSLAELECELVVTREPGATELGAALRSILLAPKTSPINSLAELYLFGADRVQHITEVIRPALSRDAIVICDRFSHSTIAYQGYGRQLPMDQVESLVEIASAGVTPDLVLLLDLDPEIGLARARNRTESTDIDSSNTQEHSWSRFEEQDLAFHRRVRQGFLEMANSSRNSFAVLNADTPPEELARVAHERITSLVKRR